MANVNSYYLYQKYEKRGDQPWIPLDVYSLDGDGTMPIVMKEEDDPSCPEPQYRTITTGTTCNNANKYVLDEYQVSYDEGNSWYTISSSTGTLIAEDSYECGFRTRTISSETYCDDANQYIDIRVEESRNYGVSWITASTSTELVAENVYECGYRSETTTGTPYCGGESEYDKYVDVYYRESRDYGETWELVSVVPVLIEQNSEDCGYSPTPSSASYLTFIAIEDGASWRVEGANNYPLQYSLDKGATWTTISTSNTWTPSINKGKTVMWKGVNSASATTKFQFIENGGINAPKFNVRGNILSTIYGDDYLNPQDVVNFGGVFGEAYGLNSAENLIMPSGTAGYYRGMFANCHNLTKAPKLPATAVTRDCYEEMFKGCTSLIKTPDLPATNLNGAYYCYDSMFSGCTALTTAMSSLPATTLEENCYSHMFRDCKSLTKAPTLHGSAMKKNCYRAMFANCTSLTAAPTLNASTLAENCYDQMFSGCTALTTVQNSLPATTLSQYCYRSMFNSCSSLERAPELPATNLIGASQCYTQMFNGCSSLNYIKCMSTNDMSSGNFTANWVGGVAASGTFVKSSNAIWVTGDDGIPYGWTTN